MQVKLFIGTLVLGVALSGIAQRPATVPEIRPRWSGAEVGEWTMDYEAAFAAAATNENSSGVLLYFAGLWWCPQCTALDRRVLESDEWKDYVEERQFYLAIIDNPARNGNGNWCWPWDPDYQANEMGGMTDAEARQIVIDRYALQTKFALPSASTSTGTETTIGVPFSYSRVSYPTLMIFRQGGAFEPEDLLGRWQDSYLNQAQHSSTPIATILEQLDNILAADPEEEADNYWQGATLLDVGETGFLDFGARTLNSIRTAGALAIDPVDWYKFECVSKKVWTFHIAPGTRGITNNVRVDIFTNPSGSSVFSRTLMPSADASLVYIAPADGTYYLRIQPPGASVLQGYHLSVERRDSLVVQTFEEYAAEHKAWGLQATGEWFYGYLEGGIEEWLRTLPLTGDETATFSGTWTGPGALMFTPLREDGAAMTVLVNGVAVTNDFVDGDVCWVALPSGKQTVTWRVTGAAGAVGAVGDLEFVPLMPAVAVSPLHLSIAAGDAREGFFAWTAPALPMTPRYMVYAGARATALGWSPEGAAFEETSCPRPGEASDMTWLEEVFAASMGKALFWRVDTIIEDAYGRQATVQGSVSSVGIVSADAPTVDTGGLSPEYDVSSGFVGVPPLTVGVQAMVGPFTLANVLPGATVRVAVRNGKMPAGLSVQVRDGAVWVTGVPKVSEAGKAGSADILLSVRQPVGGKMATVPGTSLRISWSVAPLGRVAGQYNGFRFTVEEDPGYGNVTMTVAASGKLSGKFLYEGTQYTFAAPSFDRVDGSGYFMVTNLVAKAGKTLMSVSLGVKPTQTPEGTLTIDGDGGFLLYRNNWADAAPMGEGDALANYVGYYTAALPVEAKSSDAAPTGTGYLTMTTRARGTVKYAGVLADGRRMSGSAFLLYGYDCCSAEDRLMFYLMTSPSKGNRRSVLYGLIQLVPDPEGVVLTPAHTYMTWFNANPLSVFGYDAATGTSSEGVIGFTNILNVVGGYYAKNTSLADYYGAGTELAFAPLFGAPLDFNGEQGTSGLTLLSLPDPARLPMTVTEAARLTAPAQSLVREGGRVDCDASVNPWGMTLNFRPATGLFKASARAYYQNADRQRTKTLSARGVFVPRRASYDDPTDWFGFYLISDRYQPGAGGRTSYPFNWSYDVRLGVGVEPDPVP